MDGDDQQMSEAPYFAEGWIDGVFLENAASDKQLCCFWVSPAGDGSYATNWRSLSEVDVFSVCESTYNQVINRAEKFGRAYDKASDEINQLKADTWLEFNFNSVERKYICKSNPEVFVDWEIE